MMTVSPLCRWQLVVVKSGWVWQMQPLEAVVIAWAKSEGAVPAAVNAVSDTTNWQYAEALTHVQTTARRPLRIVEVSSVEAATLETLDALVGARFVEGLAKRGEEVEQRNAALVTLHMTAITKELENKFAVRIAAAAQTPELSYTEVVIRYTVGDVAKIAASQKRWPSQPFTVGCIPGTGVVTMRLGVAFSETHFGLDLAYLTGGTDTVDVGGTRFSVGSCRATKLAASCHLNGETIGWDKFVTRERALSCVVNDELLIEARVRVLNNLIVSVSSVKK